MKEKRGFTLIELLAVIVILAVIALIATPLIMGTITKAKVNAYKDTVYGILKAGENYVAEKLLEGHYEGETLDLSKETKLSYKGTKPTKGSLTISSTGNMAIYAQNGQYCYMKKKNTDKIEVTKNAKECSERVVNNLLKNGYLEYQDTTNFSGMIYKDGTLINNGSNFSIGAKEYIPIDTNKTYSFSVDGKTTNINRNVYVGFREYDIDKLEIKPYYVMYINHTLTTLKQDLKNGDTKVYFNDLKNWNTNIVNTTYPYISKGFIFWNYKDSTGYTYPAETYSRNVWLGMFEFENVDKVNNVITLKEPWNHGTFPKGTEVSQSMDGGVYNYCLSYGDGGYRYSTDWKTYHCEVSKEHTGDGNLTMYKFRAGTKYIRFYGNHELEDGVSPQYTYLKNIVIEEK